MREQGEQKYKGRDEKKGSKYKNVHAAERRYFSLKAPNRSAGHTSGHVSSKCLFPAKRLSNSDYHLLVHILSDSQGQRAIVEK